MDITIKYPSHNDLVQWYYQLAKNISEAAGVTPEEVNALIAAYIEENPYPVVPDGIITQANAAENVVTSVNGEKGDVTVTGGGDVPENVVTTDNIAQNAVTSFNGSKGDVTGVTSVNGQTGAVTVPAAPDNVITIDNIGDNAVTSFNGQTGSVSYTPPVTSVNGMTGAVFTPIYRTSSSGEWAYGIRTNSARALIFAWLQFTFEGIDISYNTTIPDELQIKPVAVFSWAPNERCYSVIEGTVTNYDNRTIKILIDDIGAPAANPPQNIWAGCIFYGAY